MPVGGKKGRCYNVSCLSMKLLTSEVCYTVQPNNVKQSKLKTSVIVLELSYKKFCSVS